MALTPYVADGTQLVMNQVDNIALSTDTGGAGAVNLPAEAIQSVELTFEEVSPPNSHSPAGFAVATNFQIIINLQSLAEAGASTLANELGSMRISYINITQSNGPEFLFDSGDDDVSIGYFRKALVAGEEGYVWQLTAQRTLPRQNFIIT